MNLHYQIQGQGQTVVLIHGLFGSADNLGILARSLKDTCQVISVDLRNHGRSPHSEHFTYQEMAQDVLDVLNQLDIENFTVIGHSMGGKVAMTMAALAAERIKSLIVLDMAPVAYHVHRHENVFAGLQAVNNQTVTSRKDAEHYLALHVEEAGVRQFLLKSLYKADEGFRWRFHVEALIANYSTIMGWETISPFTGPTLFIKGQNSEYIQPEHREAIMGQFPNAKAHMVTNTGHWLHAEKPETVNRIILNFLQGLKN
ncbi:alpha/beta fold hydrolase [Photobacterium sp. CCB-ST2H9]|uniref:alpha/beta fold hydrolase n=1 Tax=Photobacterium sp. CCB-ST2H9 TaxID=2912855 RepID=UPI0020039094|nr:alpha/beta fold hydrolase [Photobacterium sp. CCB-ST2H9]UTM58253.1 alpha/beta fold hydrolase [Photobacterium sp. CCB-ST2H9]